MGEREQRVKEHIVEGRRNGEKMVEILSNKGKRKKKRELGDRGSNEDS